MALNRKSILYIFAVAGLSLYLTSCTTTPDDSFEDEDVAELEDPEDFADEEVASDDSNTPGELNEPQEEVADNAEPEKEAEDQVVAAEEKQQEKPPLEEPVKEPEPVVQEPIPVVQSPPSEPAPVEAPEIKLPEPTPAVTPSRPVVNTEQLSDSEALENFIAGRTKYSGRKINIEAQDEDIRNVFRLIAEESGANLVLDEKVAGKITVRLRQIPWDQALTVVMKTKGLGYVREDNILRVAPLDQLQKETDVAAQLAASRLKNDPLKVKIIPLSYANVSEVTTQAEKFLSERGKIAFDNRTSSIIVTDTGQVTDRIVRLVKTLDVPAEQVVIEGKIVEAQDRFRRNIGVRWGAGGAPIQTGTNGMGAPTNLVPGLRITPTQNMPTGLNLDLRFGTLDVLGDLQAALAIFEEDNLVKVVSSPRITTMNRQKAEIRQVENRPIQTIAITPGAPGLVNIRFEPAELKLDVTPQITSDGSVIMDMEVVREFFGAAINTNGDRPKNTRSAKTRLLVKSGQTAVVGGIYDNQETETKAGVPFLKDLPLLGWLFRYSERDRQKSELMIFLTPRIISRSETVNGMEAQ